MTPMHISRRRAQSRVSTLVLALALVAPLSGCFRYRTHVPGVIDMRTDARDVEPARGHIDDVRDDEFSLLVAGPGVVRRGDVLVVEDRHFWVGGLIPLYNTDADDELSALVDATGAARDLQIGEGQTLLDVLAALVLPQLVPLVGWVLPSYTFHARATPIKLRERTRIIIVPAQAPVVRPAHTPPPTTTSPDEAPDAPHALDDEPAPPVSSDATPDDPSDEVTEREGGTP